MNEMRPVAIDGEGVQADELVRLATLSRAMLEEARSAPCDAAGCERLRRICERTIAELGRLLPTTLRNEMVFMSVTFEEPSPSEIRVAQAELVGWLEGLLEGMAVLSLEEGVATTETGSGEILDDRPMPGQYL